MRRAIEAEEAKAAATSIARRELRVQLNDPDIPRNEFIEAVLKAKPKGLRGRPRGSKLGEPWKEAGVSKATWYRRKSK
jgi:hypothetical protein